MRTVTSLSKFCFKDVLLVPFFQISISRHLIHEVKPFSKIFYNNGDVFCFNWHSLKDIFCSMPKEEIIHLAAIGIQLEY
jgi:hypothetical protein